MTGLMLRNRLRINKDLDDPEKRKYFSPLTYSYHLKIMPLLKGAAKGKLIDVGCGDMPYRKMLLKLVDKYESIDRERRVPEVDYEGDIQDMSILPDDAYDTAICLEVLEHVPDTGAALSELRRIIKPGGILIISVPHISRLHEEPYDFYRFTEYGLRHLLTRHGFEILESKSKGGLFCFLGHQLSTVFLCLLWHLPGVREIAFFLNKWLCVLPFNKIDEIIDKGGKFAVGYSCVAVKQR